jgi:hypothetical protein
MMNNIKLRLAEAVRSKSKRSLAVLKRVDGRRFRLGLIAVALFALAYAVETKAVLNLESSQEFFEIAPDHGQNMYR